MAGLFILVMVVYAVRQSYEKKIDQSLEDPEPSYVTRPTPEPLNVEDPNKPEFPLFKPQLVGQFSSLENPNHVESLTHSVIVSIMQNSEASDGEIIRIVSEKGFDKRLTAMATALVPLAFFRGRNQAQGIGFSDEFMLMDGDTQSGELLGENEIYRQAFKLATEFRFAIAEFAKVSHRSPEAAVISKAIIRGSKLSDLTLSPPVVRL